MAVLADFIGFKGFLDFTVVGGQGQGTACAADPGFGIGDDSACIDEAAFQQRNQGQQHAGGITARIPDQARRFDLLPVNLAQAVNRFLNKMRGRVRLIMLFINGDIPKPEIRRKIDHFFAVFQKLRDKGHGKLVRQRHENDVGLAAGRIQAVVPAYQIHDAGHGRKNGIKARARILPGSQQRQFHGRMTCQQPDQFGASIPGSPNNTCANHVLPPLHLLPNNHYL